MLDIVGIGLEIRGRIQPGALLVANHVSWVDIFVINAVAPTAFVAKAEIRGWPLIGWLAAETDTVFIERGRHRQAQHVAHRMAELLARGQRVAVFPEGTTTDGFAVLRFHAALLQPAISAGAEVQPLALAYRDGDGRRTRAAAYDGDLSFADCLGNILATRSLRAEIVCLPPRTAVDKDRRTLASEAEDAVRESLFGPDENARAAPAACTVAGS